MYSEQKRTYLVYSRGLLPEDLKLGSLYLDPANPLDGEHKRFESLVEERVLAEWVGTSEIDGAIELAFTASRQWLINSGLFSLIRGEIGHGKAQDVIISGDHGRRLQIKRPESFLNDVVLESPPARSWLANRLSVSRHLYYLNRATFGKRKMPYIWLVTGVQYITNAEVAATRMLSKKLSASANIPIPEPVAAAAVILGGQEGVGAGVEYGNTDQAKTSYHHQDERVWAAQFTQLSVRFSMEPLPVNDLPTRVPLYDLVNLKSGGVRSDNRADEPSPNETFAELSVLDEDEISQPHGENLISTMQDVDWEMFDSVLTNNLYDFEGEDVAEAK